MKKKRLVTSALPYVNNIPHLGNLIQVLSADVFSRFCRYRGYETLYICGTDEYGTATETKALEEGVSPRELCDRFHIVHKDIYDWFNIEFSHFGRTSRPVQTEIVQDLFRKIDAAGYIEEKTINQLYSEKSDMFLADRYVHGTCPHCDYEDARGDQCENCGTLLDPTELINPRSGIDGSIPILKETKHLYIDLPGVLPKLEKWMKKASVEGFWANNAVQMTKSWIRDGLKQRAITRDLKWGIPVPKEGFEDKVFYVWFDAPIGYISITADLTDKWEDWWKNPEEVELFQFIGKDNIPFHTVIFPSTLLGSGDDWTMLHHMSSSEYLNYENGKFSKSRGIGVFGTDAKETGIPADVWRFYIFYNRPERSDYNFTWKDFKEKVNSELVGNLSNFSYRTLTFVHKNFDGNVLKPDYSLPYFEDIQALEEEITNHLERAELRDAFQKTFKIADIGNKVFQDSAPWSTKDSDPEKTHQVLSNFVYLLRDLAVLIRPFIPETSQRISALLNIDELVWDDLMKPEGIDRISKPKMLYKRLEDDAIEQFRIKFSGSQAERAEQEAQKNENQKNENQKKDIALNPSEKFASTVELRVAKILEVSAHPNAEKLFIEKIDTGSEERQIISGLVGHYEAEELIGKNIVLVHNLKKAKLRGEISEGMLLAAESSTEGEKHLEVLFVPDAEPGDRIILEGFEGSAPIEKKISIDTFFENQLTIDSSVLTLDGKRLLVNGKEIKTELKAGKVG
jgi:methionyl-tRNA synthetase